jgi:hypothetical protein
MFCVDPGTGAGDGAEHGAGPPIGPPTGPPIAVPDDARELARDVEAWRREQRWERRRRTLERRFLGGPTSVRRISVPLVVLVLVAVAMLGATLAFPGSSPARHTTPPVQLLLAAPTAAVGEVGGLLPDVALAVGRTGRTTAQELRPAVIAFAPIRCACAAALARLTDEAYTYGLTVYLIGAPAQQPELAKLVGESARSGVQVLTDETSTLATSVARTASQPSARTAADDLTVVGAHADGVIDTIVTDFSRTTSLDSVFADLKQPAHAGA